MRKLFVTLAVVLIAGQLVAQQVLPILNLVSISADGPTFTLTAGSEPILTGFNIMVTFETGDLINVDKINATTVEGCADFILQPFETSPQFLVWADPALNNDACQTPRNGSVLACGQVYGYTPHIRNSKTRGQRVVVMLSCQ